MNVLLFTARLIVLLPAIVGLVACGDPAAMDHRDLFITEPAQTETQAEDPDTAPNIFRPDEDGMSVDLAEQEFGMEVLDPYIPATLDLTLEDFSVGNNGISIPGIPGWITLKKNKNLALCITTQAGETRCYPDASLSRSRCPKTERCTYQTVETGEAPFVATVMNINNIGKGIISRSLQVQCAAIGFFDAGKCDDIKSLIAEANQKRTFWQGSFIVTAEELSQESREQLEALARAAVMQRVFPNSENPETGTLSAPFETCLGDVDLGWVCDPLREISVSAEFKGPR